VKTHGKVFDVRFSGHCMARQMPHGSKLPGKGPLPCTFLRTRGEKSLTCAKDGSRQKKKHQMEKRRRQRCKRHESSFTVRHITCTTNISIKIKKSEALAPASTTDVPPDTEGGPMASEGEARRSRAPTARRWRRGHAGEAARGPR
jgi:hypothetical protein